MIIEKVETKGQYSRIRCSNEVYDQVAEIANECDLTLFQSTHPRRVRQRIIAPFMAKTVYYGIDFSKKSAILAIIFKIFARMLGALLSNLVSHLHFYKSKIPVSGS